MVGNSDSGILEKRDPQGPKSRVVYTIGSMYGIVTYIWLNFVVNVDKHTIHLDAMGIVDGFNPSQKNGMLINSDHFPNVGCFLV